MRPRPIPPGGPPADLHERALPIYSTAQSWFRLHRCRHRPLHFGRTGENRFDAPRGEYGVLYAGQDEACAFIEVFGDPLDIRLLAFEILRQYCVAGVRPTRRLRLVDLAGPALRRLGADARLTVGSDYAYSQRWALALWRHPDGPDGLLYRARHDPSRHAVAIFNRASTAVRVKRLRRLTNDAAVLGRLLDLYGFGLTGQTRATP